MVKICKSQYLNSDFDKYFTKYSFELSDFQKYAIESIVTNNHILITAHTGSGKTLPAEFAIEYLVNKGKKVIYTSPIKALSNQKFHEFTNKYPNISFGILTGDIKFNPEADVLIMTTEILRNTLLQKQVQDSKTNNMLQFDMDFQNELACVVFDEIHYINDSDRGKIWEETIMLLPLHVQLVMLSATIDKSEIFASWIENVKKESNKTVYLAPTNHRVVPLKHFVYITLPQGPIKNIKDKSFKDEINKFLHKPLLIKDETSSFHEENYLKIKKVNDYLHKNNPYISNTFCLNEITKYLNANNMLPAICFVFSRKLVEKYAQSIGVCLFEEDSTVPSIIKNECEKILKKLSNYHEYLLLPEFQMHIKLLEKGVAVHHSGILPVFREMIELLFSKGYIKLLFATETFAVGINMPTKTVLFTGFSKFNGSNMRLLLPHEYTQMAGRAGRRGLDTIGYVIHLNNLFTLPYQFEYKNLLNGNPQELQSKYKISYNLILNMLQFNKDHYSFVSKSMFMNEINSSIEYHNEEEHKTNDKINSKLNNPCFNSILSEKDKYDKYIEMETAFPLLNNKKKKQSQRDMDAYSVEDRKFKDKLQSYKEYIVLQKELAEIELNKDHIENHFKYKIEDVSNLLRMFGFMDENNNITEKGIISINIQETHSLAFVEMLYNTNFFNKLDSCEIAALLSCFTNIRVKDDLNVINFSKLCISSDLKDSLKNMEVEYYKYQDEECRYQIDSGDNCEFHYNLIEPVLKWCNSEDEQTCKQIMYDCETNIELFNGEFVKALLKINNLVNEITNIAEYMENVELKHKLSQIPSLTLKFVATNQSLYV